MDPWLALSLIEGYDPAPVSGLLRPDVAPEEALRILLGRSRDPQSLKRLGFLPKRVRERARSPRLGETVEQLRRKCDELALDRWCAGRDPLPGILDEVPDRPVQLFLLGDVDAVAARPSVAIVGSRTPTPYGLAAAEDFTRSLCEAGVTVWSGLAHGIDQCAHRAALKTGGRTVAVVAGGLDAIEPVSHTELARAIQEFGGALCTEAWPGRRPQRGHFPRRNRILACGVDAVLVVEAGARSGTMHTARHAVDAGVDVYAVPGPYTSERSVGCHALLREGAQLADRPSSLLRDLGLQMDRKSTEPSAEGSRSGRSGPSDGSEARSASGPTSRIALEHAADVDTLLSTLDQGPRPEDAVQRESGLAPEAFVEALVRGLESGRLLRLDGSMLARRE